MAYTEFVEDEPIIQPLHLLEVIPYQSFEKNIFLNDITNDINKLTSCMVKEFDVITKSRKMNADATIPMLTYDKLDIFKNRQILFPKANSRWYNHSQTFTHKIGSKPPHQQSHFKICNSPLLTEDQKNIIYGSHPLRYNQWHQHNQRQSQKWSNNGDLNYLQQLSHKLQNKISQLDNPIDLSEHCVITQEEILNVLKHNWNYIESLNPNEETKHFPQSWTSYDSNIGYNFQYFNNPHNNSNNVNNNSNKGKLFWENNVKSSMKCMQPGYLQCLDRSPMDMWSIHFQFAGTRLLFSTSQLTEKSTINLQTKLKHGSDCPLSAMHQQNIFPDIHYFNNILCKSQQNGIKLYATVCFPGTFTVIKGGTLTFGACMSNTENWVQSIIIRPGDKNSIERCNKFYSNHVNYQKNQTTQDNDNETHSTNGTKRKATCSTKYHQCNSKTLWFGDEMCHDKHIKNNNEKTIQQEEEKSDPTMVTFFSFFLYLLL